MINNLKRLVAEMDSKADFVDIISKNYVLSYIYVMQNWFQSRWNIPEEKLDEIIKIAQKYLYNQMRRKSEVLKDTGYINNIDVIFEEIKK